MKSIERNVCNMYEARRQLLGLTDEMPPPVSYQSAETSNSTGSTPSNSLGLAGLSEWNVMYMCNTELTLNCIAVCFAVWN